MKYLRSIVAPALPLEMISNMELELLSKSNYNYKGMELVNFYCENLVYCGMCFLADFYDCEITDEDRKLYCEGDNLKIEALDVTYILQNILKRTELLDIVIKTIESDDEDVECDITRITRDDIEHTATWQIIEQWRTAEYVLYSASEEGFWSNEEGWTSALKDATRFNGRSLNLPMSVDSDAQWLQLA